MRYVNSLSGALLFSLALVGCSTGGGSGNALITDTEVQPELASTLEFIPTQEVGDEGELVPYEPSANPYESQRGRVNKDSVVAFISARRAYKSGDYEAAKASLEALTEKDGRLSGPWVLLGDIALEQGEPEKAIDYYVKAVEINDVNVNAYLRLAKAQRLQGHFMHAQNTYTKALAIWPDFPEAHLNLAVLYDIYLNHPLRAQKHMEAYQFLSDSENEKVADWLDEIQRRTGITPTFESAQNSAEEPLSYSEQNQ